MYTFPDLLKKIRDEAGLTQEDLAEVLDVSTVLISMIETGQKQVSRNLIEKLAKKLGVHPSSIMPFVFSEEDMDLHKLSSAERALILVGEKLQKYLIHAKAKRLKK